MSRTALKKELSRLTPAQLVEVILDAYTAVPQTKEYFDYYLNPDVEKLLDKTLRAIDKELNRSKYRNSKARTTVISKAIKHFRMFSPGADQEVRLLLEIIERMGFTEMAIYLTDTQWKFVTKLVTDVLATADKGGIADTALKRLNTLVSADYKLNGRQFKRVIKDASAEYHSAHTISSR